MHGIEGNRTRTAFVPDRTLGVAEAAVPDHRLLAIGGENHRPVPQVTEAGNASQFGSVEGHHVIFSMRRTDPAARSGPSGECREARRRCGVSRPPAAPPRSILRSSPKPFQLPQTAKKPENTHFVSSSHLFPGETVCPSNDRRHYTSPCKEYECLTCQLGLTGMLDCGMMGQADVCIRPGCACPTRPCSHCPRHHAHGRSSDDRQFVTQD